MNSIHTLFLIFALNLSRAAVQDNDSDILPAIPLVVKNSYLNTWLFSRQLAGVWPTFWNGANKGMTAMVRVNGKTYQVMGSSTADSNSTRLTAQQKSVRVTPTQSIFTLIAGPIELTINFFTPIDPIDLKRLSLPASYIAVSARSTDGGNHSIQFFTSMSAEWVSGNSSKVAEWKFSQIGTQIKNFDVKLKNPNILHEFDGKCLSKQAPFTPHERISITLPA